MHLYVDHSEKILSTNYLCIFVGERENFHLQSDVHVIILNMQSINSKTYR